MMWYPQTTELENFFFNMVITTRRWIENSQVTLFQCSFLWKEHRHQSDNRTHMGKCSIWSPKHWGISRALYRVVRRDRWKSSKNEGARAMHIPFEVLLFWPISYCLVLVFKKFVIFILWEIILLSSMHALIQNIKYKGICPYNLKFIIIQTTWKTI